MSDAIFTLEGDEIVPSDLARGPWDPRAQHGGAPAALLARAVEQAEGGDGMATVRLTYEFLRPVPIAPLRLTARLLRSGKRVQLVEATLHAGEQEVCRVTALRIRRADVPAPGPPQPTTPRSPQDSDPAPFVVEDGRPRMFATDAMEVRFAAGRWRDPGPATVWFRLRVPLVAGEQPTPLQRLAAAADFGNGISAVVGWGSHLFINPDLTIYVEREPIGPWVCLDAETRLSSDGAGVSDSMLFDEQGRIGRAQQSLFVDLRDAPDISPAATTPTT
jgi:Thioesterase-like superfamily